MTNVFGSKLMNLDEVLGYFTTQDWWNAYTENKDALENKNALK